MHRPFPLQNSARGNLILSSPVAVASQLSCRAIPLKHRAAGHLPAPCSILLRLLPTPPFLSFPRCTICNSIINNKCKQVKGTGTMCAISFHYPGEMASTSLAGKYHMKPSPTANRCCATPFCRRIGVLAITTSTLLATEHKPALSFDLRMTVPDQTVEEAESMIRDHAKALVEVKTLIDLEDWREMQQMLRKRSSLLKQDIYTIIQSKPRVTRPLLRKLYFDLFNNVTSLDYAARDQDIVRVQECYKNITATLGDILSRILT